MGAKISLLLPSCGLNYLWQLSALRALDELGLRERVERVYACSGGAWASIFFGLGPRVVDDWLERASTYYAGWHERNRFSLVRRARNALREDSRDVLCEYGFFEAYAPGFESYFKVLEVYPSRGIKLVDVSAFGPEQVHELAIASSTIPLLTGTVARVDGRVYVDGGFKKGFRPAHVGSDENLKVLLSPYRRPCPVADVSISPTRSLPSGLRLALPAPLPENYVDDVIEDGVQKAYESLAQLL